MPDNKITVRDANGQMLGIDPSDLDAARSSGAQRVYKMNAHDNPKGWWVPEADVHEALQGGAFMIDPGDFTSNLGIEGTYKMAGPGGKEPVPIKYSMVGSAASNGYVMDQSDRQRYTTDASADPALRHLKLRPGVKAVGRNIAGQVQVAPEERSSTEGLTPTGTNKGGFETFHGTPKEEPGFLQSGWNVLKQAGEGVGQLLDPHVTPEEKQRQQQSGPVTNAIEAAVPGAYVLERMVGQQVGQSNEAAASLQKATEEEKAAEQATGPEKARHLQEAARLRTLAAGHGLAGVVPFVGPMAAGAGEEVGTQAGKGNYGGAAGTLVGNTALIAAPELVHPLGSVLSNAVTSLPEGVRAGVRRTLGITDKTEDLIKKFGEDSEKVRKHNQEADEKTFYKKGVVDDARERAAKKHADDLVEHERKVAELKKKHQDDTAKRDLENEKTRQKHRELQKKVKTENEQALKDHFAELEQVARDKQTAQGVDSQRATWEQQVTADSDELRDRTEKAEKQAEVDDKTDWDAVRQKTQGQTTALDPIKKVVEVASEKADPATSALFKSIVTEEPTGARPVTMNGVQIDATHQHYADLYEATWGEPPPVVQPGGLVTFDRLQRWYSYLSNKMYGGGRVEGGLYNSYKMVRKALDSAMQDIAKKSNATADLAKARETHTQRMETFSDRPTEKSTAANAYEKRVTPEEARDAVEEEWAKKLGRYDPEIPKLGERIKSTRAALKKLPSEGEVRKMHAAEAPTPPVPNPVPPDLQPHEFKPPVDAPNLPEPPTPPDYENDKSLRYEEPEGTKPLPDPQQVPDEVKHALNRGLRRYGAIGAWVLRSIVGGEALHLAHGSLSTFGSTMLMGQMAVSILTDVLRRPNVINWLAKPGVEELKALDKLPPDDAARLRQALSVLAADEAKRLGGKLPPFDPTVSRFLLGASATQGQQPTLEDLKKQAEKIKPQQQAAPGPQSSTQQPSHSHEYDEERGIIVPVNA